MVCVYLCGNPLLFLSQGIYKVLALLTIKGNAKTFRYKDGKLNNAINNSEKQCLSRKKDSAHLQGKIMFIYKSKIVLISKG